MDRLPPERHARHGHNGNGAAQAAAATVAPAAAGVGWWQACGCGLKLSGVEGGGQDGDGHAHLRVGHAAPRCIHAHAERVRALQQRPLHTGPRSAAHAQHERAVRAQLVEHGAEHLDTLVCPRALHGLEWLQPARQLARAHAQPRHLLGCTLNALLGTPGRALMQLDVDEVDLGDRAVLDGDAHAELGSRPRDRVCPRADDHCAARKAQALPHRVHSRLCKHVRWPRLCGRCAVRVWVGEDDQVCSVGLGEG
mmetsp:Transcript_21891/g.56313  ORF Transcript_21891/g.56313 Transcript_21891/m.56313 type:complete len:252 (-) Transcript_21891:511-1266(-)